MLSTYSMNDDTFDLIRGYVKESLGIKLGYNKKVMLQARLMKRLRFLGMNSYDDYSSYLFSDEGQNHELPYFVHQVTTNKTDFFREPAHFDYLVQHALPELRKEYTFSPHRPLRVWSSACSTGESSWYRVVATIMSCVLCRHSPSPGNTVRRQPTYFWK